MEPSQIPRGGTHAGDLIYCPQNRVREHRGACGGFAGALPLEGDYPRARSYFLAIIDGGGIAPLPSTGQVGEAGNIGPAGQCERTEAPPGSTEQLGMSWGKSDKVGVENGGIPQVFHSSGI